MQRITDTTLTDKITSSELAAYYYVVTAKNSVGVGGSAQSNTFVAGTAVTPPYAQDFTNSNSFALLTLVDADGDGSTWSPSVTAGCATSAGAPFDNTDDWLFTPALALKADRLYNLRFVTTCEMAGNYPYTMRAVYTNTPAADAEAAVIQPDTTISASEAQQLGGYFSVKADGNYNVGIEVHGYRAYGEPEADYLY